jgi:Fe-S cluster biogenesis protein NfuA
VESKEVFHEKIRQLGILVGQLDAAQAGGAGSSRRELVQLLLEVHATALEKILEIAFESGAPGEEIIAKAGQDPIVRHLLLLHSLHPEDLETRVLKAIETVGPRLRKHNAEVELLGIDEGVVRARVRISGHACGSTEKTVKSLVEESIYDHAPDLASLEILGSEDDPSTGFVSVESLVKSALPSHAKGMELCGAD